MRETFFHLKIRYSERRMLFFNAENVSMDPGNHVVHEGYTNILQVRTKLHIPMYAKGSRRKYPIVL